MYDATYNTEKTFSEASKLPKGSSSEVKNKNNKSSYRNLKKNKKKRKAVDLHEFEQRKDEPTSKVVRRGNKTEY